MRRSTLIVVGAFVLPLAMAGCLGEWVTGERNLQAPDFRVTDIDGNNHTLADYQGRLLLVDMMGTWCLPCQRGVPFMKQLVATYPQLDILSISSTDSPQAMEGFRAEFNVTWPMALDNSGVISDYIEAATKRTSILWPSYALVKDERIVFFNEGETLPSTLASAIAKAADDSPSLTSGWGSLEVAAAVAFGALAWFSPFVMRETALVDPEERRSLLPWVLIGGAAWTAGLAWIVGYGTILLTGRVHNAAPFVLLAVLVLIPWWRLREKQIREYGEVEERRRRLEPKGSFFKRWRNKPVKPKGIPRRGLGLPGSVVYNALPAWFALTYAGLLSVDPGLGPRLQIAFGVGLLAAVLATWSIPRVSLAVWRKGATVGWLGAMGWILGASWVAWLRFA